MSLQEKNQQALELLKIHYGYNKLRHGQEEAIDKILNGQSTLVIMPTGGGKSLCYQLPALVFDGVTIVVSPLIALMKDQVDGLNKIGIPASFINSTLSLFETQDRLEKMKAGDYKLVYIAPERFSSQVFMEALAQIKISLFAIDEAHCISQWGHDFRPSYARLGKVIEKIGNPIVAGFTATATPEVKEDILKQLNLKDPQIVITGFARPNLKFKTLNLSDGEKISFLLETVLKDKNSSGIIYAGTRFKVENILNCLEKSGLSVCAYHGGLDSELRRQVQEDFMSGRKKIVVATNAFGMGIDKSDIRFVIHYEMPGTLEAYYQEAGRAGRDGKLSNCFLFYHSRDRYLQEFFIKGDNPPADSILEIYNFLISHEEDKILATYASLKKHLSEDLPEMAIGTALKILEKEGYIARSQERSGNAYVKLNLDSKEVLEKIKSKKQKENFLKLASFERELEMGWQVNLEELGSKLGIKKDTLNRLIKKLAEDGSMDYEPPFRGTEINILKRVNAEEVKIDFEVLKNKLKKAYAKLDAMEEFAYWNGCRQKYILDYFGDEESIDCGKCDNCLKEKNENLPVREYLNF